MSIQQGYVYKALLFIDIFLCALIFRDPDVTLSAETGLAMQRAKPPVWARLLNSLLNRISKGHCAEAIWDDIARAKNAINYLETRQP